MTKDEFQKKLVEIVEEKNTKVNALYKEYALANNPVQIRDIVTDHIGTVKVESFRFHTSIGEIPD